MNEMEVEGVAGRFVDIWRRMEVVTYDVRRWWGM
jgi:hypothetical protein